MTVLSGGLFLIEVETAPNVWTECADLTRVTKANNVTINRTRVFRKTYRKSSATDRTYTLAGLLNYADPGQAALLAAERTNTPIRVRWSEPGDPDVKSMVTARVATVTHGADPAPEAIQDITFDLRTTGAIVAVDLREDGSTNDAIRTMGLFGVGGHMKAGWSWENVPTRFVFDGTGRTQEVKSIFVGGPSIFGHAGGGATLPPYDAGTGSSTTSGTQNYRTIEQALFDMSGDNVLIIIGKVSSAANGFVAMIQKLDFSQHSEVFSPDGVKLQMNRQNQVVVAVAHGVQVPAEVRGYVFATRGPQGAGGTLGNLVTSAEIIGRLRALANNGVTNDPAGNAAIVLGGVQTGAGGGGAFQGQPITLYDAYVVDKMTSEIEAFVERRVLVRTGVIAPDVPGILCIGDSRFAGLGITAAQSIPGQLQTALGAAADVDNRGVNSRSLNEMYVLRDLLINLDGRATGRDRRVLFLGGVNTGGDSAATMLTKLRATAAAAFASGITHFYACMESPSLSDPTHSDFNAGVLAMEGDGTITKAIRFDLVPEYALTGDVTWYQDGLHFTAALNTKLVARVRLDTGL